jgi:pyruvate/2-oxoglutarate/acetoin dehydrogenase E1 component
MVGPAIEASKTLEAEGRSVGVFDLLWLSPLDEDRLLDVVVKSGGRVVIAHEANLTGGFGAEIAARLHELCDGGIKLKIKRVASPDIRFPAAPILSRELLPNAAKIVAAVRTVLS